MFYATLISLLHICIMIFYHFTSFFWTNLLTPCQVPVCFLHVFDIAGNHRKISRKNSGKITMKNNFSRLTQEDKGGARRATRVSPTRAPPPSLFEASRAYKFPLTRKYSRRSLFCQFLYRAAIITETNLNPIPTLCQRENHR